MDTGVVENRPNGKVLPWSVLLRHYANARIERYVNVRGAKKLKAAIRAASPLRADEITRYRVNRWREECLKLVDTRRHPPKRKDFTLVSE